MPSASPHQFLLAIGGGADDHEQTLRVVFEPSLDVDAIGPHVDVPLAGQVANGPSTKLRFENPDVYNSIAALAAKPLIRIVLPIVNRPHQVTASRRRWPIMQVSIRRRTMCHCNSVQQRSDRLKLPQLSNRQKLR